MYSKTCIICIFKSLQDETPLVFSILAFCVSVQLHKEHAVVAGIEPVFGSILEVHLVGQHPGEYGRPVRVALDKRREARVVDTPDKRVVQPARESRGSRLVGECELRIAEEAQLVSDVKELGRHAVRVEADEVESELLHVPELVGVEVPVGRWCRSRGVRPIISVATQKETLAVPYDFVADQLHLFHSEAYGSFGQRRPIRVHKREIRAVQIRSGGTSPGCPKLRLRQYKRGLEYLSRHGIR